MEERASFSADALTAMEANHRFCGPETMATKIFSRLSAWQNWVFIRPNASGPTEPFAATAPEADPTFDQTENLTNERNQSIQTRSRTTSTWPRIDACNGRWRTGSHASLTGGARWVRLASRTRMSTSGPPSTLARKAGPTSTTSRCPTTAGASSSPTPSQIAGLGSVISRASRSGRRCRENSGPISDA